MLLFNICCTNLHFHEKTCYRDERGPRPTCQCCTDIGDLDYRLSITFHHGSYDGDKDLLEFLYYVNHVLFVAYIFIY